MTKISKILPVNESPAGLATGANKLADAVKVTLGPNGKPVFSMSHIDTPSGRISFPTATKDGVTVAQKIDLPDPLEALGAKTILGAAQKTVYEAGDGTTSSILICQTILNAGIKAIEAGGNSVAIKKGIDKCVSHIVSKLSEMAIPVSSNDKMLEHVATVSANNDPEIGALIADVFRQVGKEGGIDVRKSPNSDTYSEIINGTRFNSGWMSPFFVTNTKTMTTEYEDALILIVDGPIIDQKKGGLLKLLNEVVKAEKPILIIADDFRGETLPFLVSNRKANGSMFVAVKCPWTGKQKQDYYEDLAATTGASVVSPGLGLKLENCTLGHLGHATKIQVEKDSCTIIGGGGNPEVVEKRAEFVRTEIAKTDGDERIELEARLGRLLGGAAIVYVGANSAIEQNEKKDRIDDAIRATRCALEEGIVPGGGTALINCAAFLPEVELSPEEHPAMSIINDTCYSQLLQICLNGNISVEKYSHLVATLSILPDNVLNRVGYNALYDRTENLINAGIIDPVKVVRCALVNGASVAGLMLSAGAVLVDVEQW